MNIRNGVVVAAAVLLSACQTYVAQRVEGGFSCYRHIRNTSSEPWTVSATNSNGNVYIEGCAAVNGPCTIAPGTDTILKYTTTHGESVGTLTFKDLHNQQRSFSYDNSEPNECPDIISRSRGPIVFNDPADGDVHLWAPSF